MDVVEKFNVFKSKLDSFMPDLENSKLKYMLNRIMHFKDKRRNLGINDTELKLFRFLIINNYKPETLYGWMLFLECPEEAKKEYFSGRMSYKDVLKRRKRIIPNNDFFIEELNWCYDCFYIDGGEQIE